MQNEKIATRVAYGRALAALGEKYDFFVMDADLSGSTQTAMFGKKFPERFANCGIAEENMVSTAAGIASTGLPVFVSSFAMFACGRAYEQIRNSVAYPRLNVKIAASHAGVTVGEDGATHQFCEDMALMRSLPNMTVVNPADATEAFAAVEAILNYNGPVYFRLGRYAVPVVFDPAGYRFELGKGRVLRDGKDAVIFATGIMVAAALEAGRAAGRRGHRRRRGQHPYAQAAGRAARARVRGKDRPRGHRRGAYGHRRTRRRGRRAAEREAAYADEARRRERLLRQKRAGQGRAQPPRAERRLRRAGRPHAGARLNHRCKAGPSVPAVCRDGDRLF